MFIPAGDICNLSNHLFSFAFYTSSNPTVDMAILLFK